MIDLGNGSVKQGDDWNWDASKYILALFAINLSVKDEVATIDIPITLAPNDSNQFVKFILKKDSVNTISLQAIPGKDILDINVIKGNGNLCFEGECTPNVVGGSMVKSNSLNVTKPSVEIGSAQSLVIGGGLIHMTSGDLSGSDALSTATYCNGDSGISFASIASGKELKTSLASDYRTIINSTLTDGLAVYRYEGKTVRN